MVKKKIISKVKKKDKKTILLEKQYIHFTIEDFDPKLYEEKKYIEDPKKFLAKIQLGSIEQKRANNYEYACIKTSFKEIIKNDKLLIIINQKVIDINKIIFVMMYLFNLYIMNLLEDNQTNDEKYDFNKDTIVRCFRILYNKTFRKKDNEIGIIQKTYEKHKKFIDSFNFPKNVEGCNYPIEAFCSTFYTNVLNHIKRNFTKFMGRYLFMKVNILLDKFKLSKISQRILTKYLQKVIINDTDFNFQLNEKVKDKNLIDNHDKICELLTDLSTKEKLKFPKTLIGNLTDENLIKNKWYCLKYYKYILDNIPDDKKKFSLLPQLDFGLNYIRFGSRFLSQIYNEWKDEDISIKVFEKDYRKYYNEMFNFGKFKNTPYYKANGGNNIPISILTNGCSIISVFELLKKVKKENNIQDQNKNKIDLSKVKKGLFEDYDCTANEKWLDEQNLIGIDPNLKDMIVSMTDTGRKKVISRNHYNEISHINRNKKEKDKLINRFGMKEIYDKLSKETYKTASSEKYIRYLTIIHDNFDTIFDFYSQKCVLKLEFDSYIHKQKAVINIAKRILRTRQRKRVRKRKKKQNYDYGTPESTNEYFNQELYNEKKNKVQVVFFGNGNGTQTIQNIKNSAPKGPIKRIMKEIAKRTICISTVEYNTTKKSNCCLTDMKHPKTIHYKNDKKTGELIIESRESHRLCCCKGKNNECHKLWNRDCNSSLCILKAGRGRVIGKPIAVFERSEKTKSIETS